MAEPTARKPVVANQVRYNGFSIDQPFTVSALVCEVTTTGTATVAAGPLRRRCRLAAGALIVDGGTVDATGTGNKSASVNVVLQPGNYLAALSITIWPRSDRGAATGRARVGHLRRAQGRQPGRRCHRHANLWRSADAGYSVCLGGLSAGNTARARDAYGVVVPVDTWMLVDAQGLQSRLDVSRPAHHLWRSNHDAVAHARLGR